MGKKAWLFMSADYYPGILTQENAMKDYCIENGIEVAGSTLSVHCVRITPFVWQCKEQLQMSVI